VTNGVIYIAIGPQAQKEAKQSVKSLKKYNDLPVTVIDKFDNPGFGARWAKLNIDKLVDYDRVLYLDADTRIYGDLTPGFGILDNWDMAIAVSDHQDNHAFWHVKEDERRVTLDELGYIPIQAQCGVFYFERLRCSGLFEQWRSEWQRYGGQDQAAFRRALEQEPVRVWMLGKPFNSLGGELVDHLFGRAR